MIEVPSFCKDCDWCDINSKNCSAIGKDVPLFRRACKLFKKAVKEGKDVS